MIMEKKKKYISIFLVVVFAGLLPSSLYAQEASLDKAEAYIKSKIESGSLTGISISYLYGDGRVRELNLGTLGPEKVIGITANTIFEIGSISKTFTTTFLAIMMQETEYSLNTTIDEFLPDSLNLPSFEGEKITLGHLATHTSGLPRIPFNFSPDNPLDPYADYKIEDMYSFLEKYELKNSPGSSFAYSNIGMGLLGHLFELHHNSTYEELVKNFIAKPLAMENTGLTVAAENRDRFSEPYNYGSESSYWHFRTMEGAGALRSTGDDMLQYLKAQMGFIGADLQEAINTTHTVQFDTGEGLIDDIGLGWFYSTQHDTLRWHNGGTGGFKSFMGVNKEKGIGVVVLANGRTDVPDEVGLYLLDQKHSLPEVQQDIVLSDEVLKKYTGSYSLSPAFSIDITLKNGQLFAQATGQQKLPIFPKSEHLFYYKVVDAELEFLSNEEGKVDQIKLYQGGREIIGNKLED